MESNSGIVLTVVFFSIVCLSTSKDLVCIFKVKILWPTETKYGCELISMPNITTPELVNITSTTGPHQNGKANKDVLLFMADGKGIEYIPQRLEDFFPNINAIVIRSSKLREIRSDDLKSYPKLVYINIADNLIQVLEDGIFDYNPKLEFLIFYGNKIIHVGLNVFNSLTKLTSLSFLNNICIKTISEKNAANTQIIIKNTKIQCRDYDFLKLDGRISSMESDSKHLNHENLPIFEQNLDNLEFEIQNSKFSYLSSFKARIQELRNQKSKSTLFLYGNLQNDTKRTDVQIFDNELKINAFEKFEKIEKDLETSHLYILKAVDMKMKEFEKSLMQKLEEVLLQNIGKIIKTMEDESDGHHSKVIVTKTITHHNANL